LGFDFAQPNRLTIYGVSLLYPSGSPLEYEKAAPTFLNPT